MKEEKRGLKKKQKKQKKKQKKQHKTKQNPNQTKTKPNQNQTKPKQNQKCTRTGLPIVAQQNFNNSPSGLQNVLQAYADVSFVTK